MILSFDVFKEIESTKSSFFNKKTTNAGKKKVNTNTMSTKGIFKPIFGTPKANGLTFR